MELWDPVIPQHRVLLSMCRIFHVAGVQRAQHSQNTGRISLCWEPVLQVGSTHKASCVHTNIVHETITMVHVGKLQRHLKSFRRSCHVGQAGYPRVLIISFCLVKLPCRGEHREGSRSMEVKAQNSCLSLWMMPRGGTVQTQLWQMQLWWRIRLVPEKMSPLSFEVDPGQEQSCVSKYRLEKSCLIKNRL